MFGSILQYFGKQFASSSIDMSSAEENLVSSSSADIAVPETVQSGIVTNDDTGSVDNGATDDVDEDVAPRSTSNELLENTGEKKREGDVEDNATTLKCDQTQPGRCEPRESTSVARETVNCEPDGADSRLKISENCEVDAVRENDGLDLETNLIQNVEINFNLATENISPALVGTYDKESETVERDIIGTFEEMDKESDKPEADENLPGRVDNENSKSHQIDKNISNSETDDQTDISEHVTKRSDRGVARSEQIVERYDHGVERSEQGTERSEEEKERSEQGVDKLRSQETEKQSDSAVENRDVVPALDADGDKTVSMDFDKCQLEDVGNKANVVDDEVKGTNGKSECKLEITIDDGSDAAGLDLSAGGLKLTTDGADMSAEGKNLSAGHTEGQNLSAKRSPLDTQRSNTSVASKSIGTPRTSSPTAADAFAVDVQSNDADSERTGRTAARKESSSLVAAANKFTFPSHYAAMVTPAAGLSAAGTRLSMAGTVGTALSAAGKGGAGLSVAGTAGAGLAVMVEGNGAESPSAAAVAAAKNRNRKRRRRVADVTSNAGAGSTAAESGTGNTPGGGARPSSAATGPRGYDRPSLLLDIVCGQNRARLDVDGLRNGSKTACVLLDDRRTLTPNQFQHVSGRGTARDWKRSIKHHGTSLKALLASKTLTIDPPACRCSMCTAVVCPLDVSIIGFIEGGTGSRHRSVLIPPHPSRPSICTPPVRRPHLPSPRRRRHHSISFSVFASLSRLSSLSAPLPSLPLDSFYQALVERGLKYLSPECHLYLSLLLCSASMDAPSSCRHGSSPVLSSSTVSFNVVILPRSRASSSSSS